MLLGMDRMPGGGGPAGARYGQERVPAAWGRGAEGTHGLSLAAGTVRLGAVALPVVVGCPQGAGAAVLVSAPRRRCYWWLCSSVNSAAPCSWPLPSGRACHRVRAQRRHSPAAQGEGAAPLIGPSRR